jgi:hypothetical protein
MNRGPGVISGPLGPRSIKVLSPTSATMHSAAHVVRIIPVTGNPVSPLGLLTFESHLWISSGYYRIQNFGESSAHLKKGVRTWDQRCWPGRSLRDLIRF